MLSPCQKLKGKTEYSDPVLSEKACMVSLEQQKEHLQPAHKGPPLCEKLRQVAAEHVVHSVHGMLLLGCQLQLPLHSTTRIRCMSA